MSAVAFQIAALPEPLAKGAPQAAAVSGGAAQSAQAPSTQADIVTLAGRTSEGQATRGESSNAAFGEATTFFFAERENFRAANGSSASQATSQAPTLPVDVGISSAPNAALDIGNSLVSPASVLDIAQPTGNISPGLGSTLSSAGAPDASGATQTPQQELAQLDQTLQQIGINPQSISLFSRMAMLLYANDPAALRNLVETLQQVAQQMGVTKQANAAVNAAASASALAAGDVAQASPDAQISNPDAGVANLATNNEGNGSAQAATNDSFSEQLVGLQVAFAAIGFQQGSAAGEVLNVTV